MHTTIRTCQTAVRALRRNVMRSALTCTGIVIGIAAVIAMMEIGNGIATLNQEKIAALGANTLNIEPGAAATGGMSWGAGSAMTLTPQDCDAILKDCSTVKAATPQVGTNVTIAYGNHNYIPQKTTGVSPDYLEVRQWPIDQGACFTELDVRNANKVCLIGKTIEREMFPDEDPVGKELRVGPINMKVVGVLSKKGASMWGQDQDDVVICPWTTLKYRVSNKTTSSTITASAASSGISTAVNTLANLYPSSSVQLYPQQSEAQVADTPQPVRFANINNIMAAADSSGDIPSAIQQITQVLRERHHIRDDQPDDFRVMDMTEIYSAMAESTALIGELLMIVAAISLIVGGVGIMNIMLVSVTERTREIGLRMAVGAKGSNILLQFLVEATFLCLLGGTIGIALGRGVSLMVRNLAHWPTAISWPAIIVSVIVSAAVGLVFGFYPAWKASKLDPIEALRYE